MPRPMPGLMVIRLAPSELMRSCTAFCAPLPIATTVITAATPMMTPSMVSAARSLLARMLPKATRIVSPISISGPRPRAPPAAGAPAAPPARARGRLGLTGQARRSGSSAAATAAGCCTSDALGSNSTESPSASPILTSE